MSRVSRRNEVSSLIECVIVCGAV